MMRLLSSLIFALFSVAVAQAGLIGTNVTVGYEYQAQASTDVVSVGPGVEISCPGAFNVCTFLTSPVQTIDITDTSIIYSYSGPGTAFSPVTPNRFVFSGFPVLSVTSTGNVGGLIISYDANSISVYVSGLSVNGPTSSFTLNIEQPIPEPGTFGLLGVAGAFAFAGLRATKRRS